MDNFDIIIWAVAAALALVGEVLTVSFFLVFFSFGAVVALVLSLFGVGTPVQLVGFIVASVASMVVLRPALLNRLSLRSGERYEGHPGIMGRSAVVTEPIEPGASGMVRVGGGEFWSARSLRASEEIEEGAKVRVLDTDGLTALVEPVESGKGE